MRRLPQQKSKSPTSQARRKVGTARCAVRARKAGAIPAAVPPGTSQRNVPTKIARRKELRAWLHTELPTQLERDTMLTPEWVAESVVMDVERFLNANLPAGFTERLAAKAYYCYDHNKHFHKGLNRAGNGGRETLFMFMRHWTAAWLKRERSALYKKLPWSFGNGQRLPA